MSDIHANLAAFFMILLEFQTTNIDYVINLGDTVGYYSKPNEVLALLAELNSAEKYIGVMGNHDISVAGFLYHDHFSPEFVASVGESFLKSTNYNAQESWSWTIAQLDKRLSQLLVTDISKTIEIDNLRFHLVHGAPEGMRGKVEDQVGFYLTPKLILKNTESLEKFFKDNEIDILLTGHTHIPHKTHIGDTMLMNSGSVGQPRDGDARTSFVTMEIIDGAITNTELHRLPYRVDDRISARFATSAEDELFSEFVLKDMLDSI
ncbi:MAG: metallophosphoesterase family protein [Candidatus Hodarchaeales archaeon]